MAFYLVLLIVFVISYLTPEHCNAEVRESNNAQTPALAETLFLTEEWTSRFYSDEFERYIVADQEIRIKVSADENFFQRFQLALVAKSLDGGDWSSPFRPQYKSDLLNLSELDIRIKASRGLTAPILWQIRIAQRDRTATESPRKGVARISVWIAPAPETGPSASPGISRMLGVVPEFACQSQQHIRYQAAGTPRIPFASRSAIDIQIEDTDNPLDSVALERISLYIVEALGTWNAACFSCATNNLLLIKVGRDFYLNSIVASAYRQAKKANLRPEVMADLDLIVASMRRNASASGIQFEKLADADPAIEALCSGIQGWHDPHLGIVRIELSCPIAGDKVQAEALARVGVRLRTKLPADCDPKLKPDPSIVACGGEQGVDLNTADFKFLAHNSSEVLFGQGEISIDLLKVVIHEVGHWIGLPHLAGNNVMAANLSNLDCINDDVINKLLAVTPAEHGAQIFALRQK